MSDKEPPNPFEEIKKQLSELFKNSSVKIHSIEESDDLFDDGDENESNDVSMSSLETKHSGKKLTFLQQIFGNIGVGGMGRGTIIGSGKADN